MKIIMQAVPLTRMGKMTEAKRFRKSIIILYVMTNPFCTFAEIYRNIKPKFNWQDLKNDFDELVSACCIELLFNKTCYVKPLPRKFKVWQEFFEKVDRIALTIRHNPHLTYNEFFLEFLDHNGLENLDQFKKSKMKTSLMEYHEEIDPKRKLNEQLFSKFFKLLQVQEKILKLGLGKMSWTDQTVSENRAKIEAHLRKMIFVLDSFESFLKNYDKPDSELKRLYPNLGNDLDWFYKQYKKYFDAHRGGKKPLAYRKIILHQTKQYSKGYVARIHGVSRKQIRNTIKPITSDKGRLLPSKVAHFKNYENISDLLD